MHIFSIEISFVINQTHAHIEWLGGGETDCNELTTTTTSSFYFLHNELKREKKIPISNVCLGGCTINYLKD